MLQILEAANTSKADAFISVTGSDENNLVACQLAKMQFGVKKTVAKSNNPKNVQAMQAIGIDNVINSTNNIASLIERSRYVKNKTAIAVNHGEASIFEVSLPADYVYDGRMLMELKIPAFFNIISITRGDALIIPRGQSTLKSGDTLLVMAESSSVKELKSVLKIKD
jgi:trk system potassium uptake protein TrkA